MAGKNTPDTMMSASRLPGLLGLSKYQTPNDELQLSINAITGVDRVNKQNEAMAWGDRIERLAKVFRRDQIVRAELQEQLLRERRPQLVRRPSRTGQ